MPRDKMCTLPSPLSFLEKVSRLERSEKRKIIRFDLAEPRFAPPPAAIQATTRAIERGEFRYCSSWGLAELIDEVVTYLRDTRGVAYEEGEALITTGGKFANYAFFASLLRRGDKVVLLKPYWTSFASVPSILGIETIEVWSDAPYHLNNDLLVEAMAKRPKAIVINTPNNPTGGMLDQADMKILRDLAVDYHLLVLSDEIDWAYAYDGRKHISPASMDELRQRTVITDGFSKVYAMTGWRVGFAAGPKELVSKMHFLQEHSISSPSTFAQWGCLEALKKRKEYVPRIVKYCDRNRRKVVKELGALGSLECPLPEGGFYAYPQILSKGLNVDGFAQELLEKEGVCVIPGTFFGDSRPTFRLCYALQFDLLGEGLARMRNFLAKKQDQGLLKK